jgi:uncharacterized protein
MKYAELEEFNPWWASGKVDPDLSLPYKRALFDELSQRLDERFILAITGLRRTGKSTLMYQLIDKLLGDSVSKSDIVFFSFDESSGSIKELIETYKELHTKDLRESRTYVFLDEIQKHPGWENELKKYYDIYPQLKFIISGSESLFIRKRTKETLAGRLFELVLGTLSFREYLEIKGVEKEGLKYETVIKPHFLDYLRYGGFPETIPLRSGKRFSEYIRSLVVDKIVYKDIPTMFGIEDPGFLTTLLELISRNPGMYIDYQSLAKQYDKDRRVVKSYLDYLRESFLIRILGNYRKGSTTLRKMKRAYPADNALIQLYVPGIDDSFYGKLAETLAVNRSGAEQFWKNGREVDLVLDGMPVEVKYRDKIASSDLDGIRSFMRKFNVREAIMLTKKDDKFVEVAEGRIRLIPLWKWLLER